MHAVEWIVIGASGFVGQNLARFLTRDHSLLLTHFQSPLAGDLAANIPSIRLDIREREAVFRALADVSPRMVVHAAGNKNVRHCEMYPKEAYETNALGAKNVASACREIGATMIYLSTDLVFQCVNGWHRENDTPLPTTIYGKSKLLGEELVQGELTNAVVCRSGGIYGKGSPLLQWLSTELKSGRIVDCFTDVFNTPTYADNLAEMVERIACDRLTGIFHVAGPQRVNRHEFFGCYALEFGLNALLLRAVEAGDQRERLLLQPDASLSSDLTRSRLGVPFNNIKQGFQRLRTLDRSDAETVAIHHKIG
ncbi:MAG: SDR family oxidoreductase [Desulfomonilaceae bacterium]